MDFRILDYEFTPIDTLDQYTSIIWTARFLEAGDFELYTPINQRLLTDIKIGYYLFCDEFYNVSQNRAHLMIIETIEITSDPESGNTIKVTGRDLKSIMDRRIVWGQRMFYSKDSVETVISTLLDENAINPSDWSKEYQDGDEEEPIRVSVSGETRRIPNLVYEQTGYGYPSIDGDYQYNGETLYDVFVELLERFRLGWEILYDFSTKEFVFRLRPQVDHTYYQNERNPLIFSPEFENLKNSNYIESSVTEKNSGLITGEGDEYNAMYNTIGNDISGLNRREMHISASDVSRKPEEGTYEPVEPKGDENPSELSWYEIVDEEYVLTTDTIVVEDKEYYAYITEYGNKTYLSLLLTKAENELAQNTYTQTYEGNAESSRGYEYMKDYDIGDICEVINEWGISSNVVISEVVLSINTNDISIIPTFASIDNSEEVIS